MTSLRRFSPRAIFYRLLMALAPGNPRFSWEQSYLLSGDMWGFDDTPYETQKYARTLETILALDGARNAALEIGCSIGVFSGILAAQFENVTAVDISTEALRLARRRNRNHANLRFVRGNLPSLRLKEKFDLITCAEILYYLPAGTANVICERLASYLAPQGAIILVQGVSSHNAAMWEGALARHFHQALRQEFSDSERPYVISAYIKPEPTSI